MGGAKGASELEGDPEEARQLHLLGVFAHQADSRGRDARCFQVVAGRADGAGAIGSNGDEADGVYLIPAQEIRQLQHRRLDLLR